MAVNKNFVVKNGLEVSTDLILADSTTNKVGIGTSVPNYPLHVFGGIGVTDSYTSGVSTIRNELNVGLGGTIFTVVATEAQDQFVGIRTANPAFLLDVRSPVSTGQTALYVQGDARITGNTNIEGDINIDEVNIRNLNVTGLSTFVGFANFSNSVAISTHLFVGGISTFIGNINNVGGGATIGNIQIGITDDDEIDTRENILVLDSAAGQVTVDDRLRVTGIGTFDTNVAVGGTLGVTGFSTFADSVMVQNNFQVGGISTFVGVGSFLSNVHIAGDLALDGGVTLETDLYIVGFATIANLGVLGLTTTRDFEVSGFSTFVGFSTFQDSVYVQDNLEVGGISTFVGYVDINDSVDISDNLNVVGISTFVGFSTFQDSVYIQDNLEVGGISTFVGVSSFLSDVDVRGNFTLAGSVSLDTDLYIVGIATVGTLDVDGNANVDNNLTVTGITTLASAGGITTTGGDLYVGGDLYIKDDLVLDEAVSRNLYVSGIATVETFDVNQNANIDGRLIVSGITTLASAGGITTTGGDLYVGGDLYINDDIVLDEATVRNLDVTGIATINNLVVNGTTDVYSTDATFHGNVTIDGNVTIGGTSTIINAAQLRVEDKDIVLGFTTSQDPTDDTANHGGIAVASTEGSPLVSLEVVGINTLPDTYKQIMWVKHNTMGAGTTDAWLFNYAVGIGSTLVPDNVRLSVGSIQLTDNTINSDQVVVSGATTSNSYSVGTTQVISSGRQLQNIASLDATTTATIESAIANAPNTFTDIKVSGVSTFIGIATFNSGIEVVSGITTLSGYVDINNNLDISGTINVGGISTFVGFSTFQNDVYVAGVVTATAFHGDGSNLTGSASGLNAAIGVGSEGVFIGAGVTQLNFNSTTGTSIAVDAATAGIATVTITPGVSLGLAIALGG